MKTRAENNQEEKSQSAAHNTSMNRSYGESTFQFLDNRPEAIAQKRLLGIANSNPRMDSSALIDVMRHNNLGVQRVAIIQRENGFGEKVGDLKAQLELLWQGEDKREAILKAVENVYKGKAVEATKDPVVIKAILAFVNSKQSETWQAATKIKEAKPVKPLFGSLKDTEKWTLRHYTHKYRWIKGKVAEPPYKEILSALTLGVMARGQTGDKPKEQTRGKVGGETSGHTSGTDWSVIGNVGDTFYGLFYEGTIAGHKQKFLDDAQFYAEWPLSEVPQIWASSDWLGPSTEKDANKQKPMGEAFEGSPVDVLSQLIKPRLRAPAKVQQQAFSQGFYNFEVKVHGSLKVKKWIRVPGAKTPAPEK